MQYAELLKKIWSSVYDPEENFEAVFDQFFHKDYWQCINGVEMNRDQYKDHVLEQRKNILIDRVDYKHIVESENELFALYYPEGVNLKNQRIKAEVIAYFQLKNQQISHVHGQVRLLEGDLADVDMSK